MELKLIVSSKFACQKSGEIITVRECEIPISVLCPYYETCHVKTYRDAIITELILRKKRQEWVASLVK